MRDTKVAIVTGTSRGLGVAMARRLLKDGFRVVGVSRRGSPELAGADFVDVRADLANAAAANEVVSRVLATEKRIDVLVNNAAAIQYGDCWTLEPADLQRLIAVNLTAPFILSQAAIRHWTETSQGGVIISICSVESEVAWKEPPQAGYAITKGGLLGLTRALAFDLAKHSIRVNGVAPGMMRTELTPRGGDELAANIPLQRLGRPEEVAGVVSFLCGNDASYMTGEVVYVDGGYRLP